MKHVWLIFCLFLGIGAAIGAQTEELLSGRIPDAETHVRNRANILKLERLLDSLALAYNRMQVETYLEYSHVTGQFPSFRHFYPYRIDSLWHDDESVGEARKVFNRANERLREILESAGFQEEMEDRNRFFDSLASVSETYRRIRYERDEAHWNFQVAPLRALLARYQKEGKILPVLFIDETAWKWMLEINPYLEVMRNRVRQVQERLGYLYQSEVRQLYDFQYISR